MVSLEWGVKRACQNCSARFYDLHRSPIVCPKCESVYEVPVTTRRGKRNAAIDNTKTLILHEDEMIVEDVSMIGLEDDSLVEDEEEEGLTAGLDGVVEKIDVDEEDLR